MQHNCKDNEITVVCGKRMTWKEVSDSLLVDAITCRRFKRQGILDRYYEDMHREYPYLNGTTITMYEIKKQTGLKKHSIEALLKEFPDKPEYWMMPISEIKEKEREAQKKFVPEKYRQLVDEMLQGKTFTEKDIRCNYGFKVKSFIAYIEERYPIYEYEMPYKNHKKIIYYGINLDIMKMKEERACSRVTS